MVIIIWQKDYIYINVRPSKIQALENYCYSEKEVWQSGLHVVCHIKRWVPETNTPNNNDDGRGFSWSVGKQFSGCFQFFKLDVWSDTQTRSQLRSHPSTMNAKADHPSRHPLGLHMSWYTTYQFAICQISLIQYSFLRELKF